MLALDAVRLEIVVWTLMVLWLSVSVWRSSRGDRRHNDLIRLIVLAFSGLLLYRDWRIVYADQSDQAKIVMVVVGVTLAAFTALALKAYGRGTRLD